VNHEDKTALVVVDRMGGIFLGMGLIVVRAKSLEDAILDLQFRIPQYPIALFGNILAIASALFLILVRLRR
jgi:Na+/glutamate symporter